MAIDRIVIIADDDDDIRDCVTELLQGEGVDARGAADGREALVLLEALGDERCILLLDLMMPKMSGYEVMEQLRNAGRMPGLPVIVCTASRAAVLPPGLCGVIPKPFVLETLLSVLQDASAPAFSATRLRAAEGRRLAVPGMHDRETSCSPPRRAG